MLSSNFFSSGDFTRWLGKMVQLPGKKANKSGLYGTGLRSQMKINAKEYFGNGVNHTPWARNWTFPVPDDLR
jgi:hypothetical protein